MADVSGPMCSDCGNSFVEDWVWDVNSKSPEVVLSHDRGAAYFHIDPVMESTGTAGVRGNKGFITGEHYWEIVVTESLIGTSVMFGVGTSSAILHTSDFKFINLIGNDEHSWGLSYKGTVWHGGKSWRYCQPFYELGTVIGVHLNLYQGTLAFFKNGQSLGVAFTGLNLVGKELYPMVSSTAACTEMELKQQLCRYLTLEEECCLVVNRAVEKKKDMDLLPLPKLIRDYLVRYR